MGPARLQPGVAHRSQPGQARASLALPTTIAPSYLRHLLPVAPLGEQLTGPERIGAVTEERLGYQQK
jgi:hypothetical protein